MPTQKFSAFPAQYQHFQSPLDCQQAYERGWMGCIPNEPAKESFRELIKQTTGYADFADAAHSNKFAGTGKGKLVLAYRVVEALFPGCYPGEAQQTGCCFEAGSLVRMADGSEKPIEQIQIGEKVVTHLGRIRSVTKTFALPYVGQLVHVKTKGHPSVLSATADHEVLCYHSEDVSWKQISDICIGDSLVRPRLSEAGLACEVESVSRSHFVGTVYCLEVEEDHSFQVNGFAVHNCVSMGTKNSNLISFCSEYYAKKMQGLPEVPKAGIHTGVISNAPYYWFRGYNGDGWDCPTAARVAVEKVGLVPCKDWGDGVDLTHCNAHNDHMYGSRPPPDDLIKKFGDHRAKSAAEINSFEELADALANGFGCNSCGGEGFSGHRDANGLMERTTSWSHSMAYGGTDDRAIVHKLYGGPLVLIQQSWGQWGSGSRKIVGTDLEIPEGWFWARWKDVSRRYVVAFSNPTGWTSKLGDWGLHVAFN